MPGIKKRPLPFVYWRTLVIALAAATSAAFLASHLFLSHRATLLASHRTYMSLLNMILFSVASGYATQHLTRNGRDFANAVGVVVGSSVLSAVLGQLIAASSFPSSSPLETTTITAVVCSVGALLGQLFVRFNYTASTDLFE